jgi:hypothetical protein
MSTCGVLSTAAAALASKAQAPIKACAKHRSEGLQSNDIQTQPTPAGESAMAEM